MLSLATSTEEPHIANLTHVDLEREGKRTYRAVSQELLVYLKGARLTTSMRPEHGELCQGLAGLTDMVDAGAYDRRLWALAALREAQELECVPLEGLALTAETTVGGEKPWAGGGEKLGLGAFGPRDIKEQAQLEELDREAEWNEQRQKHGGAARPQVARRCTRESQE